MKNEINIQDTDAVQDYVDRAQANARAALYDAAMVQADARDAEARLDALGLPEVEKRGAEWTGYSRVARGSYREGATFIHLRRGSAGRWFIWHARRTTVTDRDRNTVTAPNADIEKVARKAAAVAGVTL
ncbi:hypothetical protein [Microbacterium hydrocarbonoxydans]|uniref:hypothetical protein n=1 Tax=Microbacterium hydrocarbonoxydans TaxID=273678 RepID=UPI003D96ECCC